ncbi:MAG: zinc ribbon domain-containing protein, partial [Leptolinea sp.]
DRIGTDLKPKDIESESENQVQILTPELSPTIDKVELMVQTEETAQCNPEEPEFISHTRPIVEMPSMTLSDNTAEPEPEPLPETLTISKETSAHSQTLPGEKVRQAEVTESESSAESAQTVGEPGLLRCPHCNQQHLANLLYCPQTGKIINTPKFCPGCGKPVEPDWLNCGYCGTLLLAVTTAAKPGKTLSWTESPNARNWIILGCAGAAIIATIICIMLLAWMVVNKGIGKSAIPTSTLPSSTENALSMPELSPTEIIFPTVVITPTTFKTPTFAVTQTPFQTGTPSPIPRLTYPCISYYDQTNGDLKFICRSKNQWEPASVVDAAGDVGLFSSLSFDPKGLAHISYYSQSNGDLKYAFQDGTNWNVQTVDTSDDVGLFTSLALDWDGNAFIGYYDRTNQTVKLARQQAGKWDIQTVDQIGPLTSEVLLTEQMRISLTLDRNGYPLLSYQSKIPHQLQLARWTGSEYTIETVDSGPDVGSFCSMALNSLGYPLISYYDETNGNLKLAEWDGQNWKLEVVDGAGSDVGKFSSLAIDQKDNLYISYFADENNEDWLKVAFQKNGIWNIVSFSSGKKRFRLGWGYHTSITLDAQDNPYVAYLANTVKDLNVQYWQGKTALRYYVDSGGSVGLYPSIKFMPDYSIQ